VHDANGNVSELLTVDASGNATVAVSYRYTPFGETLVINGDAALAAANPYRFSGKEQDALTGLYYYGQRFYDSRTGRFLNRDPLGEEGGLNLYGFVANNPMNFVDPLGLSALGDLGAAPVISVGNVLIGTADSISGAVTDVGQLGLMIGETVSLYGQIATDSVGLRDSGLHELFVSQEKALRDWQSNLDEYSSAMRDESSELRRSLRRRTALFFDTDPCSDLLFGLTEVGEQVIELRSGKGPRARMDDLSHTTARVVNRAPQNVSQLTKLDAVEDSVKRAKKAAEKTAASLPDLDFIQRIATKAESTGVRLGKGAAGTGPGQGTWKHDYAKRVLERYQRVTDQKTHLLAEQSWLGGSPAKYGTKGSARPDVFDPLTGTIYDYKFVKNPGQGLSTRQINKNLSNVPGVTSQFEINQ
jgi:RHS repeat-associated protein